MNGQEVRDGEGKLIAILKTLSKSSKPLGSTVITRRLESEGLAVSERGVRYHLKIADERGFTQSLGRGGRMITDQGRQEIKEALASRQIGLVQDKLKMLAYQTTFIPEKLTGQIPINTSLINEGDYKKTIYAMKDAFEAGICISDLMAVVPEGEKLGSVFVPQGKIGIATVSSVVINGVLLKAGIPTEYKFGGILEIKTSIPKRFTAIIDCSGTSIDPSEEFISSGFTGVIEASRAGDGKVLGAFRTIPALAREAAQKKIEQLKAAGISGICATGNANEPLCQVPVDLNRMAMVLFSGLNPVAAAAEAGIIVENTAGSGLIDYRRLHPFHSFWRATQRGRNRRCYGE